jgi:DNA helicase-2/ATP-dependent DNA helicase PcrA
MTPTPEQLLIIAEAKTNENLLVSALAGAAKTSTLVMLAAKLPLVPTLSVAFNKKIADEMAKRMPSHISCKTMNAIGHRTWADTTRKRLSLETDKSYDILKEITDAESGEAKKRIGECFASVLRATRLAKSAGYIPKSCRSFGASLIEREDFIDGIANQLEVEPDQDFLNWLDRSLERSITDSFAGRIDFDDQIYMSTLFGGTFAKFPIVMVDEAQDLSPLNHIMLEKTVGTRLIAVGDPNQAIYGFRGAHKSSMELLKRKFSMKELTLSVSFRCPRQIVERARWRAPNMQYPAWAVEGHVEHLSEWGADNIPDGAAIICRNNAPLLSVALRLIRAGRGIKLLGNDIGKSLVATMKKFGQEKMPQAQVLIAISEWEEKELKKARESRRGPIHDKAACMRVFAQSGDNLGKALAFATHLFEASGPIQLMTGHKSKGLEYDTVYHLDSFLIPSKFSIRLAEDGDDSQLEQERNLRYVIETRSMKELFLINSEDYR